MAIYNQLKNKQLVFSNNYVQGSSYIMNDGKYLDIKSSKQIIYPQDYQSRTKITHASFDHYLQRVELSPTKVYKYLVESDNAIALNDGTNFNVEKPYFVLPQNKPTNAQFTSLLNWLDYITTISDLVQIEDVRNQVSQSFYFKKPDNDGWLTDDIIKEIKKMYN